MNESYVQQDMCAVSIALHCVGIFLLTGLSLLETMLVCFLVGIDNRDDNDSAMVSPEAVATAGSILCNTTGFHKAGHVAL